MNTDLEIWIAADRERVFDALTTQSGLDAWWGRCLAAEPKVGFVVELDHGLGGPLLFEITELVPNERVVWRCVSDYDEPTNPAREWQGQQLTFALDERREVALLGQPRDVTVLHFTQTWPEGARWRGFCSAAWGATLNGSLKEHCEEDA